MRTLVLLSFTLNVLGASLGHTAVGDPNHNAGRPANVGTSGITRAAGETRVQGEVKKISDDQVKFLTDITGLEKPWLDRRYAKEIPAGIDKAKAGDEKPIAYLIADIIGSYEGPVFDEMLVKVRAELKKEKDKGDKADATWVAFLDRFSDAEPVVFKETDKEPEKNKEFKAALKGEFFDKVVPRNAKFNALLDEAVDAKTGKVKDEAKAKELANLLGPESVTGFVSLHLGPKGNGDLAARVLRGSSEPAAAGGDERIWNFLGDGGKEETLNLGSTLPDTLAKARDFQKTRGFGKVAFNPKKPAAPTVPPKDGKTAPPATGTPIDIAAVNKELEKINVASCTPCHKSGDVKLVGDPKNPEIEGKGTKLPFREWLAGLLANPKKPIGSMGGSQPIKDSAVQAIKKAAGI